jgi:hypothetical protein
VTSTAETAPNRMSCAISVAGFFQSSVMQVPIVVTLQTTSLVAGRRQRQEA